MPQQVIRRGTPLFRRGHGSNIPRSSSACNRPAESPTAQPRQRTDLCSHGSHLPCSSSAGDRGARNRFLSTQGPETTANPPAARSPQFHQSNPQSPIRNPRFSSAFTSIELLVVIAVALIIMALMGVVWRNIEARNRRSAAQTQIADIAASLSDYWCEKGCNPDSLATISNRLPRTFTAFSTNGIPLDPWGNEYQASTNSAGQWTVFSCGPDGAASTDDDNIVAGRF